MDREVGPDKGQNKKQFESYYLEYEVQNDTSCGYSVFKGSFLQFFLARKNCFIVVNGVAGCLMTACFTYFSGSISSIEKLYGIPSQQSGILSVGNDISQVLVSLFIAYYLGSKHRPRWMGIGFLLIALYCFMSTLPHFLYGTGKDVLLLTKEYGELSNSTSEFIAQENQKKMCQVTAPEDALADCKNPENYMPQVILFSAQIIAGVGNGIYSALNTAYLDDNVEKSKAPWVISVTHFIKLFGPAFGFALASLCLKIFIEPASTPVITPDDPRWIGAWWIGMIVLGVLCTITALLISLFPKRMPRYVAKMEYQNFMENGKGKRRETEEMIKEIPDLTAAVDDYADVGPEDSAIPTSLGDLWQTTLRIIRNKIFMLNLIGIIFYFYGCFPYWIFLAKYIEVQYRTSSSEANLYTGLVGLIFSALGVLSSGIVLSRFRPSARKIVLWNVITTICTCFIYFSYNWMGCAASDRATEMTTLQMINQRSGADSCSSQCHCDFVKYSPICGEDGLTYISPCHAGCKDIVSGSAGIVGYTNCSCIPNIGGLNRGSAFPGSCKVNCNNWSSFYIFMAVLCLNNFLSASGIAGSVLIGVRSVLRADKTFALGFKFALSSLLAFIPSPIMFGALIDKACIFWGKTPCGDNTNCWIYNGEMFRTYMNTIASALMFASALFNIAVWFNVGKLAIFDEEVEMNEQRGKSEAPNNYQKIAKNSKTDCN